MDPPDRAASTNVAADGEIAVVVGRGRERNDDEIHLGLVVTPALDAEDVEKLLRDLERVLAERYPGVNWKITAVRESLLAPPAGLAELVDAARSRLLEENWDLVVHVTELPLRISRRPLLMHSSPTHGAALVSLPALGPRHARHLVESVAEAVGVIAGDRAAGGERKSGSRRVVQRRVIVPVSELGGPDSLEGFALTHRVLTGNLRLLAGMVRANHPWRLTTRLSRAMVGALGVATFTIVTTDVWRIASGLAAPRMAGVCLAAIASATATLIFVHGLWERATRSRVREQAILFNVVTLITVSFGIVALYAGVCLIALAAAELMLEPSLMSAQIGHRSDFADYLRLALLAGALATVGGAFGGALESDAAVREATYAYRHQRPERDCIRPRSRFGASGAARGAGARRLRGGRRRAWWSSAVRISWRVSRSSVLRGSWPRRSARRTSPGAGVRPG